MNFVGSLIAALVFTNSTLGAAIAADKVKLAGRLLSAPIPPGLIIQKPGVDVPKNIAAFSGAWGLTPGQRKRAHVLVVTKVTSTGKARVIYSMGTSRAFDPFFRVWNGKISGDTLTVEATRGAVVTYTRAANNLHAVWSRGDRSNNWEMNRLDVISNEPQQAQNSTASSSGIQQELESLRSLLDNNLITAQQFETKRAVLLEKVFSSDLNTKQTLSVRLSPTDAPKPETANINFGRYHALVIGINAYRKLNPLKTAVADAQAVAKILSGHYSFRVDLLLNPTRKQIVDAFDALRTELTFKDNLLIYYAGHGWLDEGADRGFWLPVDADQNRRSNWVSNVTLTDTLKALQSKHVMVVADSCYSGRLTRSAAVKLEGPDYFKKMSRKKARVVITSGGLEPVEDGNGQHSPFARAFLNSLNQNESVIDGTQLFGKIRKPVVAETNQTPQYSDIAEAGHDGGDFLFVRRN